MDPRFLSFSDAMSTGRTAADQHCICQNSLANIAHAILPIGVATIAICGVALLNHHACGSHQPSWSIHKSYCRPGRSQVSFAHKGMFEPRGYTVQQ